MNAYLVYLVQVLVIFVAILPEIKSEIVTCKSQGFPVCRLGRLSKGTTKYYLNEGAILIFSNVLELVTLIVFGSICS